jgi:hypothetical protein
MTALLPQPQEPGAGPRRTLWIVLAACGGLVLLLSGLWVVDTVTPKVRTTVFGMPHVWVGADDASAFMIQVARQGNTLSGTLDETGLDSPGSTAVSPVHAAFTGTIDGSAITLNFPQGFGFTTSISGTLSGDTMTLQAPQSSGSVASVTLRPASVDIYNRRATAVQASAVANADASAAAQAAAAEAAARQKTQKQINRAADTVAQDVAALRTAIGYGPNFSEFDRDIATAEKDLQQAKTDAAQAATEPDRGSACVDANTVRVDANSVQIDANSIQVDTNGVQGDVNSVNGAVDALNKDLSDYRQTATAMPTYAPANAPDAGAIQSLVEEAGKQTSAWKTKVAQYQNQVAQLVAQANDVAAKAQKQYC